MNGRVREVVSQNRLEANYPIQTIYLIDSSSNTKHWDQVGSAGTAGSFMLDAPKVCATEIGALRSFIDPS